MAEFYRAVIALQNDCAGFALIGIARDRRQTLDRAVVDDRLSIENHRDLPSNQANVEGLPFAGRLGCIQTRRNAAIQRAIAVAVQLSVIVPDLNLISGPQSDPAVAFG